LSQWQPLPDFKLWKKNRFKALSIAIDHILESDFLDSGIKTNFG